MTRLQKKYIEEAIPAMKEKFGYKNNLAVPKIVKVTLNVGINSRNSEANYQDAVENTLLRISGQKPIRTRARAAISAFKIKENMVVGAAVTLRGTRMYDFLDKLINISLPRVRDFRGLSEKSVDQQGNLSLGFKEHIVFPEIRSDEVERIHGLQINVTTTAKNRDKGLELFKIMGFPMIKSNK